MGLALATIDFVFRDALATVISPDWRVRWVGPRSVGSAIANIIASAVADGKTVLFVAKKMAALDVVKRRLDANGVGVFTRRPEELARAAIRCRRGRP